MGGAGIYFARMDAVRMSNIESIRPFVTIMRSRGNSSSFYQVGVTDKQGKEHLFLMRSEKDMYDTINFLQAGR